MYNSIFLLKHIHLPVPYMSITYIQLVFVVNRVLTKYDIEQLLTFVNVSVFGLRHKIYIQSEIQSIEYFEHDLHYCTWCIVAVLLFNKVCKESLVCFKIDHGYVYTKHELILSDNYMVKHCSFNIIYEHFYHTCPIVLL